MLRRSSLAAVARLPERLVEIVLLEGGRRRREFVESGSKAESAGVPKSVHTSAEFDQKSRHVPAAVADRVVERGTTSDRITGRVDVGPALDQRGRHLQIVTTCRPVPPRGRRSASRCSECRWRSVGPQRRQEDRTCRTCRRAALSRTAPRSCRPDLDPRRHRPTSAPLSGTSGSSRASPQRHEAAWHRSVLAAQHTRRETSVLGEQARQFVDRPGANRMDHSPGEIVRHRQDQHRNPP